MCERTENISGAREPQGAGRNIFVVSELTCSKPKRGEKKYFEHDLDPCLRRDDISIKILRDVTYPQANHFFANQKVYTKRVN